jgi:hypothetical protein
LRILTLHVIVSGIGDTSVVRSTASTVQEYLDSLPADRRAAITVVRDVVQQHLRAGYREATNWGMISYEIPPLDVIGEVVAAMPPDALIALSESSRRRSEHDGAWDNQ